MVDGRVYVAAASAAVTSVMANSVRPHRRHTTRLPRPWDSPGKNTGVGCHCLLQCMKVKSESEVAQSCPIPSDPMDCSLLGSSTHGFSRQEYWSGLPFSSLGIFLTQGWVFRIAGGNTLPSEPPGNQPDGRTNSLSPAKCLPYTWVYS